MGEVCFDIALDGAQPGHADATALGNCGGIARCAEGDRDEIAKLGDDQLPHLRRASAGSSNNASA